MIQSEVASLHYAIDCLVNKTVQNVLFFIDCLCVGVHAISGPTQVPAMFAFVHNVQWCWNKCEPADRSQRFQHTLADLMLLLTFPAAAALQSRSEKVKHLLTCRIHALIKTAIYIRK